MAADNGKTGLKLVMAAVLLLGASAFLYSQYANVSPNREELTAPVTMANGQSSPSISPGAQRERPSDEERRQMRTEMLSSLNLSAQQQQQIAELDSKLEGVDGREAWQQRREAMQEILTDEQQEQMRSSMRSMVRSRMEQRAAVLPPQEREKFMEKLEERIAQRGQNGGGGRGGRGGRDNAQ